MNCYVELKITAFHHHRILIMEQHAKENKCMYELINTTKILQIFLLLVSRQETRNASL